MWQDNLSENVYKLRRELDISARRLSQDLGLADNYINNLENKRVRPTVDRLVALSQYFGVSVDDLLGTLPIDEPVHCIAMLRQMTPKYLDYAATLLQMLLQMQMSDTGD